MATVAKNSRSTTSTLASATAGPFDVGFRLFDDDALLVYVNGVSRADWTLSSTYLSGYDDDATITFDDALAISDELRIEGWLSPARSADYVNGDPDLVGKMNVELARLWSSVIEVKREVSRALRGFDDLSPIEGVDLETVSAAESYATAASASATAAAASEAAALAAENSLLEWQGAWLTATAYAPSDLVQESGNTYVCLVAHTSGTFSTDLAALKWELFAAKGASGAGSGDVVAANNGTEFTASTFAANLSLVQTSRAISAGTGLTGGGNLSADRSIAADIASQAEAEAGSSSTKLMTPQRTAQAIAELGASANASAALGAIGSYAFLAYKVSAGTITAGDTYAGSDLQYVGVRVASVVAQAFSVDFGASPSGTWMAMGHVQSNGTAGYYPATLFLRVS